MSTHNVSFFSGWSHWFKFALQNTLRNRRRSAVTVRGAFDLVRRGGDSQSKVGRNRAR